MFSDNIDRLSKDLIEMLTRRGLMIVTAESCTGGLIAGALTEFAGSSAAVHGGYVTYANAAKQAMIEVPEETLKQFGAVSEQTARAMAEGAIRVSGVAIAIAVTGVAGPGGGSPEKPVGLVHFACATADKTLHLRHEFGDLGRKNIRLATVERALQLVLESLADQP